MECNNSAIYGLFFVFRHNIMFEGYTALSAKLINKIRIFIVLFLCLSVLSGPLAPPPVSAYAAEAGQTVTVKVKTSLNMRSGPGMGYAVIRSLYNGQKLTVVKDDGGKWLKVKFNGTTGYVYRTYVVENPKSGNTDKADKNAAKNKKQSSQKAADSKKVSNATGGDVAKYAVQFVGNPYVWGGESLTRGADCSGFTKAVYKHFGYYLPHYDRSQRAYGKSVKNLKAAKPGDLIFYSGHVAIYIGSNKIVHAANRRDGIKISYANYRTIACIRRIIK